MSELIIKYDELTAEEFIYMWESVWGEGPSLEQTKLAMDNTLFRVSIFDGNKIVAMARVMSYLQKMSGKDIRSILCLLWKVLIGIS